MYGQRTKREKMIVRTDNISKWCFPHARICIQCIFGLVDILRTDNISKWCFPLGCRSTILASGIEPDILSMSLPGI